MDLLSQTGLHDRAAAVVLKGVAEYDASFTLAQAHEILLATHVGDEVLEHKHGYPLRAIVPSRRGWHWVKWLTEIEVVTISGF
jgi:DMSO/TMAO reductase YedYZ molybdopterin-dependent catalytic subunit